MPQKTAKDVVPGINPPYDPYAAAKKAKTIGPDPSQRAQSGPRAWLDTAMKYMTGYDPDPNWKPGVMDVLAAGIPFAAPMKKVFHGAPKAFNYFNPKLNAVDDMFGRYVHFADEPGWAEVFAERAGLPVSDPDVPWRIVNQKARPNIIPAKLKVQNALDFSAHTDQKMLAEDLLKLAPHVDDRTREIITEAMRNYMSTGHMDTVWLRDVVDTALRDRPQALQSAGFDGIRYMDASNPAWAVPDPAQAETPWGAPLHTTGPLPDPPKSRNVPIRDYSTSPVKSSNTFGGYIKQTPEGYKLYDAIGYIGTFPSFDVAITTASDMGLTLR